MNKHGAGIQATNVYASMGDTDVPKLVDDIPKSIQEIENQLASSTFKEHTKNIIKSAKPKDVDSKRITISQGTGEG